MIKSFRSEYKSILAAVISLILFIVLINRYARFDHEIKEKDIRENLLELLISKKSQLEKSLYSRIYYTKGVAAYCSLHPDITGEQFGNLAGEIIHNDSVISSMSIAKNCIINAIYPYKGHESAIGLNLLEHPARKTIVDTTIKTKNTFVAGPVELVEGGIAFISYTPIFTKEKGESSFWGVTDIVILKDKLFNEAKLEQNNGKYSFALMGADGTGSRGKCFWGDSTVFLRDPVLTSIDLPTGTWTFAAVPVKGWDNRTHNAETIFLYISAFIISLLIWLLVKAFLKIRTNERELKAMFGAMHDVVIQFNSRGEYIKIAPTNENLLVRPLKELLGKSLYDVFDREKADYFMNAIRQCLDTKEMVILHYNLVINNRNYWFQGRITYLSDDLVLYVAHDNTAQKKAEEYLNESRQQLIEMNAAKDKFFSIIAHDLKGPFLGFLGISEELNQNISKMSQAEIAELASVMHAAAKKTYNLLNNLLDWSRLHTGKMKLTAVEIDLRNETDLCCYLFEPNVSAKSIKVLNEVEPGIKISADKNMFNTIVRNVLSNSIKFTKPGGEIRLTSERADGMAELTISDSGLGIKESITKNIFRIDSGYSTKGTNGEEGTGLGLILCKELVEKNGGEISISSVVDKGTTIKIKLPLMKNEN